MKAAVIIIISCICFLSCKKNETGNSEIKPYRDIPCYSFSWLKYDLEKSSIRNGAINIIEESAHYKGYGLNCFVSNYDTLFKYTLEIDYPFTSSCSDQHLVLNRNYKAIISEYKTVKSSDGHNIITGAINIAKKDTILFSIVGMGTDQDVHVSYKIE